ncbi:MAG TPA: polysaccharide deacetylase family protein [Candidatus Krumholzibacteria bacterium]
MMVWVILLIVGLVVVAAVITVLWTLTHPGDRLLRHVGGRFPSCLFRIATSERALALTIDDAPHPDVTPGILEELRRHDARATFFVIGSYAKAYPHLVDAIRADGHELANHLFTDRMSARLNDAEFVDELKRTEALIQPLDKTRWCRPGSGLLTTRIIRLMQENGYTAVGGTAYPVDLYTNARLTALHFLRNVRPGAILVLHDGGPRRASSIRVLAMLLPQLRKMGYRIVTLGELSRLREEA